jgi:hypothetical protein
MNKNSKLTLRHMQLIGSTLVVAVVSLLSVWFYFLYTLVQSHAFRVFPSNHNVIGNAVASITSFERKPRTNEKERSICDLRNYPPHRYYKLDDRGSAAAAAAAKRPFLESDNVEYIFGEWPTLLHPKTLPTKVCVDQSDWLTRKLPHWPFADGTNPSILHMDRIKLKAPEAFQLIKENFSSTAWVATVCMTNSQCTWKDDGVNPTIFDLPDLKQMQPDVRRLLFFFMCTSH